MSCLLKSFCGEVVLVKMMHSDVPILAASYEAGAVAEPRKGVPQQDLEVEVWLELTTTHGPPSRSAV